MERYKPKKQNCPAKAIQEHCKECMGGRESKGCLIRVRECSSLDCSLHDFRLGKNPFRKKQSEKQLLCSRDHLIKPKKAPSLGEILT
jgi:hypothetical protein